MRRRSAAPELATPRAAGTSGDAPIITPLPADLPAVLLERLRAEGVMSCEQWQKLGPKRGRIWGVTKKIRKQIDRAVVAAIKRGAV